MIGGDDNHMQLLHRLAYIDQQLFLILAQLSRRKLAADIAKLLSKTGDGYLQVIVPLLIWTLLGDSADLFLLLTIAAFIVERGLYWLLKNGLKRQRPPRALPTFNALITASDEFSFPSGHTSAAFLLVVLIVSFTATPAAPLVAWACMVAASRIILGVHFPADVIAGAILGSSVGCAIIHIA